MSRTVRMSVRLATAALGLWLAAMDAASAQDATRNYQIAEQPLGQALREFAVVNHLDLLFSPDLVAGKKSASLDGKFTVDEGLRTLLKGSGLEFVVSGSRIVISEAKPGTARQVVAPTTSAAQDTNAYTRLAQAESTASPAPTPSETGSQDPNPERSTLEEIVVTGTNIRGATSPSPIISIDHKEIERSGYQSTGDLVRNVPQSFAGGMNATVVQAGGGAQNQNQYTGASSVNLRGFGSESTLTLVNGERLANSDNLSAVDVSAIPLAAIDRIDVLTDGASALYGSDAVAGVVNFILKKNFRGVEARASYGETASGGGASQLYSVLGGNYWDGGNVTVAYEHAQQQPIFARERSFVSPDIPGMSLLPRIDRDSVFAAIEQSVTSGLDLFAQGLYTERSSHQYVDYRALQGAFSETEANVRQYGVAAGAKLRLTDSWLVKLSGSLSRTSADAPQTVSFTEAPEFNFALGQRFVNELHQVELKADGELLDLPAGPLSLAVGASYRDEGFREIQEFAGAPPPITDIDADRNVKSAYAELNVPVIPRNDGVTAPVLSLVAAGRYDRYSDSGSETVPKLGLVYAPRRDLQLKASWSRSFRAPTLSQEYTAPIASLAYDFDPFVAEGNSFKIYLGGGNQNLKPESATSTTVSASFTPAWLDAGNITLTYYHIDYDDRITTPLQGFTAYADPANQLFIVRDPTAAQLEAALEGSDFFNNSGFPYDPAAVVAIADGRFLNASRQTAQGVDVVASYRRAVGVGELGITLNGTYLDLSQKISSATPEQRLSGIVFNPARVRARAGTTWQAGGFGATAYVNFVSSMSNTVVTPEEHVGSWTTADLQLAYDFPELAWARRSQIALSIQNIFDRDPPFINALSTTPPGVQFDSTNASALGRYVGLTLVVGW